jgi:polar amino acid transport system substrate-binding protein
MKKLSVFLSLLVLVQSAFGYSIQISYIERPPYYFTKNKQATGFLFDLQKKIFSDANIEVHFVSLPAKRALKRVRRPHELHCSIGWFKTPEREKFANFTLPIYQNRPLAIVVKKKNSSKLENYSTLKDIFLDKKLTSTRIDGFSYGTFVDKLIKELSPEFYTITGEQQQLIRMLAKERMTYLLVAPEEIATLISINNLNAEDFTVFRLKDIPAGNKRYLMCSKGVDQEVIDKINLSIQKFVKLSSF